MIVAQYKSLHSMWFQTVEMFIKHKPGVVDRAWSPRLFSFHNMLRARTPNFDFDFAWVGLTKPRWARFLHQYVARDDLVMFFEKSQKAPRGASVNLYTRRHEDHAWGPCVLGATFMPLPDPGVSLFSRASSFAQTGIVDLAFAYLLAKYLSEVCAIPFEDISVNWYCSMLYMSAWHIIPYLASSNRIEEMLKNSDGENKLFTYVKKLYETYFIERRPTRYGPAARMIARHDSIQNGTLKSVPVSSLDFTPVLGKRLHGEIFWRT